jgi:hypothetical protein
MTACIKVGKVAMAIIDSSDLDAVTSFGKKWQLLRGANTNYAYIHLHENGKRRCLLLHRFLLNAPSGHEVDHIDGNGLNNSRANLRLVTRQQNKFNQRHVRGIYWNKRRQKWYAQIKKDQKVRYLGSFETEDEALAARKCAERELFGAYAK